MAAFSINQKKYLNLLRKLMPDGTLWAAKYDRASNMSKLLESLSYEAYRVEERGLDLIREANPASTIEMLGDWERVLGLPDECSKNNQVLSIQERRARVLQVLTTRGGQNVDFYKTLASNFGFDISVIEVKDQPPFRAGIARAGDRLTNGDWRYAFIIQAPTDSVVRFRAGQSSAGDPLLKVSNSVLECLMQKHKPAHTIVIFTFGSF